jgi:3-methyladenine DNA glycosylase AlkC
MPEPLKNRYTRAYIEQLASSVSKRWPEFKARHFIEHVLADPWPELELKARMRRITLSLHDHLPRDFGVAIGILSECSVEFSGFEAMYFPEYAELYGLEFFDESMRALEIMTRHSSAEFAVRPFIIKYPERMMRQMLSWSRSPDDHLRRLASEGCRPRLPWAMALPAFKKDPSPILPILENLFNDEADYVYRSVANNLNDISKDHPQLVLEIAARWQGQSETADWVVKHACRSLLKQGDREALALFGFSQPAHIRLENFQCDTRVAIGANLDFSFNLLSDRALGLCRLEYRIHYRKANGSLSGKVFKISEAKMAAREKQVRRQHSFRPVTTRVLHKGEHRLEVLVNGRPMVEGSFELV